MQDEQPLKIFIAFAKADRDVRDKLLEQMNLVKAREHWDIWASHEIAPGAAWDEEIRARLDDSDVVVLLLSTSFFNSGYIKEVELPLIEDKHRAGKCYIIPVLARTCLWKDTSFGDYASLSNIQAVPSDEWPIVSKGKWDSDDTPYVETVKGIKTGVRAYKAEQLRLKTLEKKRAEQEETKKNTQQEKEVFELLTGEQRVNNEVTHSELETTQKDIGALLLTHKHKENERYDFNSARRKEQRGTFLGCLAMLVGVLLLAFILFRVIECSNKKQAEEDKNNEQIARDRFCREINPKGKKFFRFMDGNLENERKLEFVDDTIMFSTPEQKNYGKVKAVNNCDSITIDFSSRNYTFIDTCLLSKNSLLCNKMGEYSVPDSRRDTIQKLLELEFKNSIVWEYRESLHSGDGAIVIKNVGGRNWEITVCIDGKYCDSKYKSLLGCSYRYPIVETDSWITLKPGTSSTFLVRNSICSNGDRFPSNDKTPRELFGQGLARFEDSNYFVSYAGLRRK